jgi:N-acylneuraminate cytidylyltransferase
VNNFFTKTRGYNAFINHYANLAVGKIDAFAIGTEMRDLTKITSATGVFPAVTQLVSLASTVKTTLGSGVKITYAADWSEYHHTDGGWYHLDPLWMSSAIDVIGIDAYFPLTDAPLTGYDSAAIEAGCFDEIMVSTDDAEIAQIAAESGALVPFMRSAATSDDRATTADVILEVLSRYEVNGTGVDLTCCIYPTAPFISGASLRAGYELLVAKPETCNVIPITRFSYPIQRALKLQGGQIAMFHTEHQSTRSQDLEPAYHDAGQFYWLKVPPFLASRSLMAPGTAGLVLPECQVQDIDNEDDWILAEMKYELVKRKFRASASPAR